MTDPAPAITHVLEIGLYVADLDRSQRFYAGLFGCETYLADERMRALGLPGRQVLLLFRHGGSIEPSPTPQGIIPPHDAHGRQHIAFAIPDGSLDAWAARLEALGIAVESRIDWPSGAVSLYFRDPDQHSLELATPRLWPNYGRSQDPSPPGD